MHTIFFSKRPCIGSWAAVAGKMEAEGPLGIQFDKIFQEINIDKNSWEKSESELQKAAVKQLLSKSNLTAGQIDHIFAGDLLNQCIGTSFGVKDFGVPHIGLYGACSTMALSILLASVFVDNSVSQNAIALTSSHYASAERQYRYPLEYGNQRTPSAQWTATASGAELINKSGNIHVNSATVGTIEDLGIKDAHNMGAAMAPAAAKTIKTFFDDTDTGPDNYCKIYTGDLGEIGVKLLIELLEEDNIYIKDKIEDCGLLLYDREKQDVHAGGSGCGCSAAVLCTDILNSLQSGSLKNVLFIGTGALLSPVSVTQNENVPAIAHLINISAD